MEGEDRSLIVLLDDLLRDYLMLLLEDIQLLFF